MDACLAATQRDLWWLPEHVETLRTPEVVATRDDAGVPSHNQVVYTGGPAEQLPALVDRISAWQHAASRWLVVPGQHAERLREFLPGRGYVRVFQGDAFTLPVDRPVPSGPARVVRVHDLQTFEDALQAASQAFALDLRHVDRVDQLALCTGPQARTARFVAYAEDGTPAGSANINRFDAQSFGFLWGGCTVEGHRGRGVYRSLLAARRRWAAEQGLDHIGLYAKRTSSGPIVTRIGFDRHGSMEHWDRL